MRWLRRIAAMVDPPAAPPVHRARLLVSSHLLHELLLMPDTMTVVGVALHEGDPRTITVLVDDPALAAVAEGEVLPQVEPVFRTVGPLVEASWLLTEGADLVVVGDAGLAPAEPERVMNEPTMRVDDV